MTQHDRSQSVTRHLYHDRTKLFSEESPFAKPLKPPAAKEQKIRLHPATLSISLITLIGEDIPIPRQKIATPFPRQPFDHLEDPFHAFLN